jgi:hypothetical protein
MNIENLSAKNLKQATDIKRKIEHLESQLSRLLGGASNHAPPRTASNKKRKMSAAAKAKISASQTARWKRRKARKA